MKFPHFFIERPIFASVLSFVIVLVGTIVYFALPVSQYPEVALPTVIVRASYPGATPQTIAETVATPIEQELNGVDNMLYMESSSSADGTMQLTVTFQLGTNLDDAQVLVQNRVAIAETRLPEQVRQIGVTTRKQSPNLLLVVHLLSPDSNRDELYISNYAFLHVRDILMRQEGMGDISVAGGNEYSMRIWLDIEKMTHVDLTAGDVVQAIRQQNVQVAAGVIGQPPIDDANAFQLNVTTQGRLREADEFGRIIVKRGDDGRVTRLDDVARIELGAQDYSRRSYLDGNPAVALLVFQRPGTNAVDAAASVKQAMSEASKDFPPGLSYEIAYNTTEFVEDSIDEVFNTLFITTGLVVLTVFLFLHGWRPTIILDSGLFHGLSDEDRIQYAGAVGQVLLPNGKLYLQCFSDQEPAGDGPRRVSEAELLEIFQSGWRFVSRKLTRFAIRNDTQLTFSAGGPKAWFCEIERISETPID